MSALATSITVASPAVKEQVCAWDPLSEIILTQGYMIKKAEFIGSSQRRFFQLSARITRLQGGGWVFTRQRLYYYESAADAFACSEFLRSNPRAMQMANSDHTMIQPNKSSDVLDKDNQRGNILQIINFEQNPNPNLYPRWKGFISLGEEHVTVSALEHLHIGSIEIISPKRKWQLICNNVDKWNMWVSWTSSIGVRISTQRDIDSQAV